MQLYIYIALGNDCRWRQTNNGRAVDRAPDVSVDFLDIDDCAVAYMHENGLHVFSCTKNMPKLTGSVRPRLLATLKDGELPFKGRVEKQLCIPAWFENLEEDGDIEGTIIKELPDFSTWVCDKDDGWTPPAFSTLLIAQIVDKLLTAINENQRAKVVLACSAQNLKAAQELLRCTLRCLPVKLANRLTFNTASKKIKPYDICCGIPGQNFNEGLVEELDGVWFDIDGALADYSEKEFIPFANAYAEYLSRLKNAEDPCDGYEESDDVDTLNAQVKEKVLIKKADKLVKKCKTNEIISDELINLKEFAQENSAAITKRLNKIAEYLSINYVGYTKFFINLTREDKDFYLSYVADKGKGFDLGGLDKTDSLITQNDEQDHNAEYISNLYGFWQGTTKKTAYKHNADIGKFLFSDYDKRFKENENLYNAFKKFWDSLNDDELIEFLKHGTALNSKDVESYIIFRKGKSPLDFVKYCCTLKNDKGISIETINRICNNYLLLTINDAESKGESLTEKLEQVQKITSGNSITLTPKVVDEIQKKIENEKNAKLESVVNYLWGNDLWKKQYDEEDYETREEDKNRAKRWINEISKKDEDSKSEKGEGKPKSKLNMDDIVVYNIARLDERDCGEAGFDHGTDRSRQLKGMALLLLSLFFVQCVVWAVWDCVVLNRFYISGWAVWIEIVLTAIMALFGILILFIFVFKNLKYECDKDKFETVGVRYLKAFFVTWLVAAVLKIAVAVLIFFFLVK